MNSTPDKDELLAKHWVTDTGCRHHEDGSGDNQFSCWCGWVSDRVPTVGDGARAWAQHVTAVLTPSVADEGLVGDTSWKPLDQCEDEAEIAMYWRLQAYSARRALQQVQPVDGLERVREALPLMRAAFRTTTCGPSGNYMTFKFPTCVAVNDADDEWRAFQRGDKA